MIEETQE
jgi:hypothetical protein